MKTSSRRRVRAGAALRAVRQRLLVPHARGEEGFLLVEVLISALLVALIVTATFNGLDVATKLSSEQRHRGEAILLAAQSQEQLRSEPASALVELASQSHKYTRSVGGVTYTIVQEAISVGSGGNKTGCSVTETTTNSAANFRVVSTVTWNQQEKNKRNPITSSSVISPPTGSGIEVDVVNGSAGPVSGVSARTKFIPSESGSEETFEGTTGSAGCIVFSGIQATEAEVEVLQKTGYVTPKGTLVPKPQKLTIAPNLTTHVVVAYAEGGAVQAKFTYKGATSWEGKEVKSDTFVVSNVGKMETAPEYELGSTAFTHETLGEERFEAQTGTYANTSYTAKQAKYPAGDLFPFSSAWTAYAGDCSLNDVNAEDEAKPGPLVKSGETTPVELPLAVTKLSIYTGRGPSSKGSLVSTSMTNAKGGNVVKITNTSCESAEAPNNSTGFSYTHGQKETLPGTTKGGMLENPFQPVGKYKLCLVNSAEKKTYSVSYENALATISEPIVYLGQRQSAIVIAERKEKETAYKAEETAYKTAEAKYKEKETKYKEKEAAYKAKEANKEKNKEAETKKKEYETKKKEYETKKVEYENKKKEYENKKKEYEKTGKSSYKTEYEKFKTEYEKFKTEYETFKTEYEALATAYKKAETEYNEYAIPKAEYENFKTEYEKYKAEYVEDKAEYEKLKSEYEKAKAEEKEATESGVTVQSAEEC